MTVCVQKKRTNIQVTWTNLEKVHFLDESAAVHVFRLTQQSPALVKIENGLEAEPTSVSEHVRLSHGVPE